MHKPCQNRGGRPTKKTPDREPLVLKAIAKGVPYKAACQCADLSLFTFNEWRKNDSAFAEKVRRVDLEAISRNVDLIQHAAEKGDWRAPIVAQGRKKGNLRVWSIYEPIKPTKPTKLLGPI